MLAQNIIVEPLGKWHPSEIEETYTIVAFGPTRPRIQHTLDQSTVVLHAHLILVLFLLALLVSLAKRWVSRPNLLQFITAYLFILIGVGLLGIQLLLLFSDNIRAGCLLLFKFYMLSRGPALLLQIRIHIQRLLGVLQLIPQSRRRRLLLTGVVLLLLSFYGQSLNMHHHFPAFLLVNSRHLIRGRLLYHSLTPQFLARFRLVSRSRSCVMSLGIKKLAFGNRRVLFERIGHIRILIQLLIWRILFYWLLHVWVFAWPFKATLPAAF